MEKKRMFRMLAVLLISMVMLQLGIKPAKAVTIKEDGKYALVLTVQPDEEDGDIDGNTYKIIRFDFDEGETTVSVNALTEGLDPYNGKNVFSYWAEKDSTDPVEALSIDDFKGEGRAGSELYRNGHKLYANFSGQSLADSDRYYVILDGYGGTVNGKEKIRLGYKVDEFKTVNLNRYKCERKDCDFYNWNYNGKILMTVDRSWLQKTHVMTLTALYKSRKFYGVDANGMLNNPEIPEDARPYNWVLKLDAAGGTINGKEILSLDYLAGANSGTDMPIFHYVPTRKNCRFKGWSNEKNGDTFYNSIFWNCWRPGNGEFDRDGLIENTGSYRDLTLYAVWEYLANPVTSLPSTGAAKGSIEEATDLLWDNYSFLTTEVNVPEALAREDVRYLLQMDLVENGTGDSVEVQGNKMNVRFELPAALQGYDTYEIVTVSDDRIAERIPVTVKDGVLSFETTKLGLFGVAAKNDPPKAPEENNGEDTGKDPAASAKPTEPSVNPPAEEPAKEPITEPAKDISAEEKKQNSQKMSRKAAISWKKGKIRVTWGTLKDADGYDIFVMPCGKEIAENSPVKTVKGAKSSTALIKIAKTKSAGSSAYKAKIKAYKMIDGEKVYIGNSQSYHIADKNDEQYTNAKKITVSKKSLALKKGKKAKIKAVIRKEAKAKELLPASHGKALRYDTSDATIATVTSKGVIRAKKKGSCVIYITALNGVRTKVRVTVK